MRWTSAAALAVSCGFMPAVGSSAGPAWARWPGRGRSPAGACRRRAGCGPALALVGQADELQQAGALEALPLLAAEPRPPDHRRDHALPGAAVPADQHILAGGHVREQAQVLEGPGDAELGDPAEGNPLIRLPWKSTSPSLGANSPMMQLKKVVLPVMGPIQPTICPGPTTRSTAFTATSPSNRRVTLRASRIAGPSSWGRGSGSTVVAWSLMCRSSRSNSCWDSAAAVLGGVQLAAAPGRGQQPLGPEPHDQDEGEIRTPGSGCRRTPAASRAGRSG